VTIDSYRAEIKQIIQFLAGTDIHTDPEIYITRDLIDLCNAKQCITRKKFKPVGQNNCNIKATKHNIRSVKFNFNITCQTCHPTGFHRTTACNAMQGIANAFLSVCLSNACTVTKRKKLVPTFLYMYHKKHHSS